MKSIITLPCYPTSHLCEPFAFFAELFLKFIRHNGAALSVIVTCIDALPKAISISIAFFDTTFHHSIPSHISAYAIDQSVAKQKGSKKCGFHGLSGMQPSTLPRSTLISAQMHSSSVRSLNISKPSVSFHLLN
jgi:hypothetical protein